MEQKTVESLVRDLGRIWSSYSGVQHRVVVDRDANMFQEAELLKLSCDKASHFLGWSSILDYHETVRIYRGLVWPLLY